MGAIGFIGSLILAIREANQPFTLNEEDEQ